MAETGRLDRHGATGRTARYGGSVSIWQRKAPKKPAVRFVKTERVKGGTYHVHGGPDLAQAMTFLRQTPVTEPSVYVVVETPEGNVGRDFIYIFRELDGTPIEHGPRSPLPEPVSSTTHCAWCGFYVEPFDTSSGMPNNTGPLELELFLAVDDILNNGGGFRCKGCDLLQCGWCSGLTPGLGEREVRCRSCGAAMHPHLTLPARRRGPVVIAPSEEKAPAADTEKHWKQVRAYCEQWRDEFAEADRNPADKLRWRVYADGFKDGMRITLSLHTPQGDVKSLVAEIKYSDFPLDVGEGRELLRKRFTRLFDGLGIPLPQLP